MCLKNLSTTGNESCYFTVWNLHFYLGWILSGQQSCASVNPWLLAEYFPICLLIYLTAARLFEEDNQAFMNVSDPSWSYLAVSNEFLAYISIQFNFHWEVPYIIWRSSWLVSLNTISGRVFSYSPRQRRQLAHEDGARTILIAAWSGLWETWPNHRS